MATWAPTNPAYWDPYPAGLFYNHADWLGTERVRTTVINGTLTVAETCTDTPYGMNLSCNDITQVPDTSPMHFTGKQRDAESGLDYFGARFNASNLGRFMTPDWAAKATTVPYADFGNPQSLNLYAYVGNNPMSRVDTDGHDCLTIGQYTIACWNRSAFQSIRDAEDAHEAKHREDSKNGVDEPGWKKEQRGYAAEIPILEKRIGELEAKEKNGGLTPAEKKELAELKEEHDTATSLTQGAEADRNAQRYYRNNQNWIVRQFIPDPDADIKKPKPQPPPPPHPENRKVPCFGCEGLPKPNPEDLLR